MKNLISIADLSREEIEEILDLAAKMQNKPSEFVADLAGKSLAIAFFEPSLRTRAGFSLAMQKLGGGVIEVMEQKFKENMSAPETLEDTFRILGDYADVVAIRHPSQDLIKGLKADCHLINCGNGNDEHPTQTLIDLYTVRRHFGRVDGLKFSLVGDLKGSRAAHSLVGALKNFSDVEIRLISPNSLRVGSKYLDGLPIDHVSELPDFTIDKDDVVYMAGFPPSKDNPETTPENRRRYQMDEERARSLPENAIILNPLPRVDEITEEVDALKSAKYFEESKNGLFVRMAILKWLLL